MEARWRPLVAFAIDLVLVAVFVGIGRASHGEDQSAYVVTFWPFAIGLAAGWAVARGWRRPFARVVPVRYISPMFVIPTATSSAPCTALRSEHD